MWTSGAQYARKLWCWETKLIFPTTEPATCAIDATTDSLPTVGNTHARMAICFKSVWMAEELQTMARWARKAWIASPRFWVYAAASRLYFCLEETSPEDCRKAPPREIGKNPANGFRIHACPQATQLLTGESLAQQLHGTITIF